MFLSHLDCAFKTKEGQVWASSGRRPFWKPVSSQPNCGRPVRVLNTDRTPADNRTVCLFCFLLACFTLPLTLRQNQTFKARISVAVIAMTQRERDAPMLVTSDPEGKKKTLTLVRIRCWAELCDKDLYTTTNKYLQSLSKTMYTAF